MSDFVNMGQALLLLLISIQLCVIHGKINELIATANYIEVQVDENIEVQVDEISKDGEEKDGEEHDD